METESSRGFVDLMGDLFRELSNLYSKEMRLARVELSEKLSMIGIAIGTVAVGVVLMMAGLVLLLEAAVAALVESGFTTASAALFVGGLSLVIGIVLLLIAVSRFKAKNIAPTRTMEQLHYDVQVAKHQVNKP